MTSNLISEPISVLLVDDHPVVRAGYRRLFESTGDINVVAEADNGETGCFLYEEHKPDVMILDLNMEGIDGLETIRRIKAKDPDARILVFSMHNQEAMVRRVFKFGATGYITKQSGAKEMNLAVRRVKQGKTYIDPELASKLVANFGSKDNCEDPLSILTAREFQIFKLHAEGNSCAQIAKILSISPKTAGVHYSNIMKKLKLQNKIQLVRLAINHQVI